MADSVLLIDDDVDVLRSVGNYFEHLGYEVSRELTGEAGVSPFDRLRPEGVLLDLNLPGDTGWDLLRGPLLAAAGSPPVIITSATTVSPKRLAEFCCAGYLPKPFPLATLVATIERLLPSRKADEHE